MLRTALQNAFGHKYGKKLQCRNDQQRVAQRKSVGNPCRQQNEQSATGETTDVKSRFLNKNIGVLVPLFDRGYGVNDQQLNCEIGDVSQGPGSTSNIMNRRTPSLL